MATRRLRSFSTRRLNIKMPNGEIWKPKNYQNKFFGPSTLRRGIEQSRNVMTVRLADDLGMTKIADLAQRLGIYDKSAACNLPWRWVRAKPRLLKMVTAYSMIDNGGKKVEATLIDRIQDRFGHTIYQPRQARLLAVQAGHLYGRNVPNLTCSTCANR